MAEYKVMIVDDEPDIRQLVRILLEANGYHAMEAQNAQTAIELLRTNEDMDLIVMDIMMPGMNGLDACKEIRDFSTVPMLFLTARLQEADKRTAYDNGGDDYLCKPFSQAELLMKVSSLIRRYRIYRGRENTLQPQTIADITIDFKACAVYKNGVNVNISNREYELLLYFLNHRGMPTDTKTLYEKVWQQKHMPSSNNTVMVHILNLRKKLEDDVANPTIIKTVWGRGYQID